MRLLHLPDLELKEFAENRIPRYAILSHTWGDEEVTYQDFTSLDSRSKDGYTKIKCCGDRAAKDGWEYLWVDTCCIDKRSSAELSEAINSMFRWYKNAEICYVYLSDVSVPSLPYNIHQTVSTLKKSRWFTRGWTLQELIAPSEVLFLDKDFQEIGNKRTLLRCLEEITTIDARALAGAQLATFSVARRMSWAAKRETTRVEDIAYSLMGIFDIHMPLLYGEGEKSFVRLQEEIMRSSDDQSIFAWKHNVTTVESSLGLLARSPNDFAGSRNITPLGILGKSDPFTMTNTGLHVLLFLIPYNETQGIYRACLDCQSDEFPYSPAIYLQKLSDDGSEYTRIKSDTLHISTCSEKWRGKHTRVYVRQKDFQLHDRSIELSGLNLFSIKTSQNISSWNLVQVFPSEQYDPQTEIFQTSATLGKVGALLFRKEASNWDNKAKDFKVTSHSFEVVFGISRQGKAWCQVLEADPRHLREIYESYAPNGSEGTESQRKNIVARIATRTTYRVSIFHITVFNW